MHTAVAQNPLAHVLIVDDERGIREILSDFLELEGYSVVTAGDGVEALEVLSSEPVDLVLTDMKMPRMGGIELLEQIRDEHPRLVTLLMTGYGTVETAIEAMKAGAFDYVLKPFRVEDVVHTVGRALDQKRIKTENIELRAALSLYRLAARLGDTVELAPTLDLVVETVREQTGADQVGVMLFPDEDTAWAGASAGPREPITEADLTPAGRRVKSATRAEGPAVSGYLTVGPRTSGVNALLMTPLVSKGRRLGLLVALRATHPFNEGDRKLMTIIADRAAVAVQNAQLYETLESTFVHTIEAFVTALEEKDRYTAGHSERVAEFAQVTAEAMGLPAAEVELIYQGGRLHDIGKLTLRPEDLNKPAALTNEEYERFKAHPQFGEDLMAPIPAFRPILAAMGGHHERWDGKGYPRGIAGETIPLIARIIAVADTYDAMTSHRAYRSALKHSIAVGELATCAGTQFDPEVVDAFLVGIERWRDRRRAAGREYPR
jgi:response regulator RpfG family c-di-GMP phosphodiesterase